MECTVYIDGFNHNSGKTWEHAIENLKNDMSGKTEEKLAEIQAPKMDVVKIGA